MPRIGICGPSYSSQAVNADAQMTMNFYPEFDESGAGNAPILMYPTPGLAEFVNLGGRKVRGQIQITGRTFVVADANFIEVMSNASTITRGMVSNDGQPVSMAASPQQLLLASAGLTYVYNLQTNVLTPISETGEILSALPTSGHAGTGFAVGDQVQVVQTGGALGVLQVAYESGGVPTGYTVVNAGEGYQTATGVTLSVLTGSGTPGEADITCGQTFDGPISQVGICDDFFIALVADSKEFYVSAALDATDWVANGSAIISVFPDNVVGMLVDHREIWFYSDTQSVVYYDSGNVFPFDVIPGAFIEAGLAAEWTPVQLNNTVFWLGADSRGSGVAWCAVGYLPQRVSNHAVEFAWQSYARIDDAVAFPYQDQGHQFWVIYFPTANATWVYDVLTQMWHERGYLNLATGQFGAARYWNHTFNFGKHLVGDWASGILYEMHIPVYSAGTWTFADDNGNPIRRVRRAPHISNEQQRQFSSELQVYLESGIGPIPPLTQPDGVTPRGPTLSLRWSTDGGHTWSDYFDRDCGQAGAYHTRVRWLRLGRSRDRVFEISTSDPWGPRIVDAYLDPPGIVRGTN